MRKTRHAPAADHTGQWDHRSNTMTKIEEAIAQHPYMLHIERIICISALMTDAERAALTAWAEEAVESAIPFDASNWPGWSAVARRVAH